MKIRPTAVAAAILSLALVSGLNPAKASERMLLRDAIIMHENAVTLSDLLPVKASEEMRIRARKVALGEAPLPGERRTLRCDFVSQALNSSPDLRNMFEIPDEIEVTRWSRFLTREDVFNAIRETMLSNSLPGAGSLTPQDVSFSFPVTVTEEMPALKVTRIEPAPDGGGTRIRLWTISEPRVPPFWVRLNLEVDQSKSTTSKTVEPPGAIRETETRPTPRSNPRRNTPTTTKVSEREEYMPRSVVRAMLDQGAGLSDPLLVARTGETVQLVLQGRNLRITTTAVPLDVGRKGQKIRVRTVLTGKILVATVVAANRAEVDYLGGEKE
jgi:hypothetical protein